MLVAIDGPAGAGKSTVARALARELGFAYLDSGAMYRCVALLALASPATDPATLARGAQIELAGTHPRSADERSAGERSADDVGSPRDAPGDALGDAPGDALQGAPGNAPRSPPRDADDRSEAVILDGRDVTAEIRAPEVTEAASRVAADQDVRAALVAKQRDLIATGDWVAEGRDIGTVVAPDAELKVFLTADPRERARRRANELGADAYAVLAEQALRDERDSTRAHSPLRPAPGAVTLDTTGLSVGQVVERIAGLVRAAAAGPG